MSISADEARKRTNEILMSLGSKKNNKDVLVGILDEIEAKLNRGESENSVVRHSFLITPQVKSELKKLGYIIYMLPHDTDIPAYCIISW